MDQKAYQSWAAAVPELSKEQVKDLLARIRLVHKQTPDGADFSEDWLLQGLIVKLKQAGVLADAAVPMLLRSKGFQAYKKASGTLRADLDRLLVTEGKSRQKRLQLAQLVAGALLSWLKARRLPVTPNMVLLNAPKAFEALNESFPGYIAANLLHVVLSSAKG